MTVAELIMELEDMDPDVEVRLAMAPRWPMEYTISQVEVVTLSTEDWEEEEQEDWEHIVDKDYETVVYLVEGGQIGYLPGQAKQELGW